MTARRWRLLVPRAAAVTGGAAGAIAGAPPAGCGAENMAIDQAMLESVQTGGPPSLRLYRWSSPTLSLGRNQAVDRSVGERAASRGWDVVRRPTGGAAVLHDLELTYAVALPVGMLGSPRESYAALNRGLIAGLRELGVPCEAAPGGADAPSPTGPCFGGAAPGEVTSGGRKLVGSAQRCKRRCLLQHGSILLDGDQTEVSVVLAGGSSAAGAAPATTDVAALLGGIPAWDSLVHALLCGFRRELGISFAPADLTAAERARIAELASRFASPSWTWRR